MTGDATTAIVITLADAVRAQCRTISRWLSPALDGRAEPLRRTRVASRRLRESLAVVTLVGLRVSVTRLEREARRLTRALGPVRELDVALVQFELAGRAHRWPPDQQAALHRALEILRDGRRRRMLKALHGFDRAALSTRGRQLANAISGVVDTHAWWRALGDRVRLRAADVVVAIDACGMLYAPDRLHALRIAIKKLRYALEFAGDLPGVSLVETIDTLKHAQARFGHLHDVQILQAEIERVAATGRRSLSRQVIDDLERECRMIHAEILPLLPGLRRSVLAVQREARIRASNRRLAMAKADAPMAVPAGAGQMTRARRAPQKRGAK